MLHLKKVWKISERLFDLRAFWMVHCLKGEIPLTAKGSDGLHLKRVSFNETQNVTFEKSKF